MDSEQKLLKARAEDRIRLCEKYAMTQFSQFLNETQISFLREELMDCRMEFFGGYPEAQRCVLGVFPEWEEKDLSKFPISILKVENSFSKNLTHRDYLGSVLSLGLERTKIGDILTGEGVAYIFVMEDVSDYIIFNLKKIGNCGVKIKRTENIESLPKKEFKTINAICASKRLDAVLAGALKKSRNDIKNLIISGKVSVNHKEITDVSHSLSEGDLLSVRGEGRILFDKIGTNTKSGRLHIVLKQYVR